MSVISPATTVAPQPPSTGRRAPLARLARLVDAPRITGLDVARALAVLGMIGAHVAAIPEFTPRNPLSYLSIVHGNSSILFALLAGISVALMTGRTQVPARTELPRMRLKIVGRAAFIFLIGLLLELTGTTIVVILPFFAALFLISLPFLAWSSRRLFWTAVVTAVLGPPLVQLVMQSALLPGGSGITFLVAGVYQITTWLPLLLAGMAIGRMHLSLQRNAARIAGIGAAFLLAASVLALTLPGLLAPWAGQLGMQAELLPPAKVGIIGTGTPQEAASSSGSSSTDGALTGSGEADAPAAGTDSPAAGTDSPTGGADESAGTGDPGSADPVPVDQLDLSGMSCQPTTPGNEVVLCWKGELPEESAPITAADSDSGPAEKVGGGWGTYTEQLQANTPPTHVANAFLQSGPHTGGSLETLGSGGLAALVVGVCLLVTNRWRGLRRALAPLAALGSMPLTAYSAHVLIILAATGPGGGLHSNAAWLWMGLGLGLILACTVWALWRGRGPLESLAARAATAMAAGTEGAGTAPRAGEPEPTDPARPTDRTDRTEPASTRTGA